MRVGRADHARGRPATGHGTRLMARIAFGAYMVRYPVGGSLSSQLQWILAFRRLGHEVLVLEKSGWAGSCFDPVMRRHGDAWARGFEVVDRLLARYGITGRLAYVDAAGQYHGLTRSEVMSELRRTELY